MSGKPILYSYWRSSCSWRVRAALALLDIDYDYRAVNLLKSEQKSESYLLMNPTGTVPTLVIPEDTKLVLCDSIAIMHYLHEVTPGSKLLPSDPGARAKVREICNIIASGTQPVQNLKKRPRPASSESSSASSTDTADNLKNLESFVQKTIISYDAKFKDINKKHDLVDKKLTKAKNTLRIVHRDVTKSDMRIMNRFFRKDRLLGDVSMDRCCKSWPKSFRVITLQQPKLEWGRHWIEAGFRALEMVLSTCSAQYCFGETVTMADCCLVPQVYNANRFNVPIEEFPNISRVHAHLTLLPQFKAAHPNLQPDCPDEFKGK